MGAKSTGFLCCAVLAGSMVGGAETQGPVAIRVVDEGTGKPVKRFTYDYRIDSPDRHDFPTSRDDVEAVTEDGVIRIPAPQRCRLRVCATTPWHLPPNCFAFKVLPDDQKRTFTLEIARGATVRGVVLDAKTGKPLAGARVSPRYFGHPTVRIAGERAVKTDKNGRFVLGGVSTEYGVCVKCQGYETLGRWLVFESNMELDTDDSENTFRLQRNRPKKQTDGQEVKKEIKPRLFGTVADERGKPVGPYRVVAAAMHGPDPLISNKEYYFAKEINNVPAGELWELRLYGDAKFYWIMGEASGFASSVQVVQHEELDRPIQLRLRRGFSLSGGVEGPSVAEGKAVAMVQPMYLFRTNPPHMHHHESPLHCIQASRFDIGPDGQFAFDHLGTGTYLLQIAAAGATPVERLVTLRDKDVRLQQPLKMQAAGRIEGIVYNRDGEPRAMESCHWSPPETIDPKVGEAIWGEYLSVGGLVSFTTDEHGCFVLDNAPAGRNSVGFYYKVLTSVFDFHRHLVNVLPGRTTEVQINVPEDSELCWKLPVEVVVGNGSGDALVAGCSITNPKFYFPPKWRDAELLGISLAFEPLPGQAVSWPDERVGAFVEIPMAGPGRAVVTGIHPGKYRMTNSVRRWSRCDLGAPFVDQVVDVKPHMKESVRVRLPGASVQVDFEHPKKKAKNLRGGLLMALGEDGKPLRGEFTGYTSSRDRIAPHVRPCLDFVPLGRYTLLVWRDGLGWARSKPVDVEAGKITDGGLLRFQPGGTIRGRIAFPEVSRRPRRVVAVESGGIRIKAEAQWSHEGYTFVVRDLWPGQWTVAAMDCRGQALVERRVTLKGAEVVEVE